MHTCHNISYQVVALTSELVVQAASLVFLSLLRLVFSLDKQTLGISHSVNKEKHIYTEVNEFKPSKMNPGVAN